MLVLTRKVNQKIRIGNGITITMLKVQGDQISVGIEAPKDLLIIREELMTKELEKEVAKENHASLVQKRED